MKESFICNYEKICHTWLYNTLGLVKGSMGWFKDLLVDECP